MKKFLLYLALLITPISAHAVQVTVGDLIYDIAYFPTTNTYEQDRTVLESPVTAPWFGNETLANDLANAFSLETGGIEGQITSFAYNTVDDVFVELWGVSVNGPVVHFPATRTGRPTLTQQGTIFSFAYLNGAPIAVPEINGSTLAQLLLILGCGYLGLTALRARQRAA